MAAKPSPNGADLISSNPHSMEEISVLLFEDNPGDCFYFYEMAAEVKSSRLVIEHVTSLHDGLLKMADRSFDIILLDLNLTDSWGLDTFRSVLALAADTPIIVLSGMDATDLAIAAVSEGAQDYISKSHIASDLLERAVVYALARGRLMSMELELQEARLESETAVRVKRHFLSNVSHELRTPLTATIGYLQLLTTTPDLPSQALEYAKAALQHGYELEIVVGEVLEMSKIESNELSAETENINLQELCKFVIDNHQQTVAQKGLELRVDICTTEVISTDAQKLQYILNALLDNAVKFTLSGTVTFTVRCTADQWVFQITDTGMGIPEEQRAKLFTAFHSDLKYQSTAKRSAGLGLAISQAYAQLLGASIEVQSQLHQGSEFTVTLPRLPVAPLLQAIDVSFLQRTLAQLSAPVLAQVEALLMSADVMDLKTVLTNEVKDEHSLTTMLQAIDTFEYDLLYEALATLRAEKG